MIPWFRDLAVSDRSNKIMRDHISQWINDLKQGRPRPHHEPGTVRRAYAPKTIANLHGLLFSVLQAAVTADPPLRDSNPCAHTRLPKGGRGRRRRGLPRTGGVRTPPRAPQA